MSTRRERASRHASRMYYCTCGRTVFGNGGKSSHFGMHKRRGDGHHRITQEQHAAQLRPHDSEKNGGKG